MQTHPTTTSSQRKVLWAVGIGIVVIGALMAIGSVGNRGIGSPRGDFTKSDLVAVAGAAFPDWTIMPSDAQPITETQVMAIAYASDPTESLGMAATYLYESPAGFNASGEADTRAFWKSNSEAQLGSPYSWLTCRNAMFLVPIGISNQTSANLRGLGC